MTGLLFRRRPAGRTLEVAEAARIGLVDRRAAYRPAGRHRSRRPLVLLLTVLLLGLPWMMLSDRFYVYGAETTGARRLTNEELLLASGLVGKHVLTVRPEAIEANLLSGLPTLKSAHVSCRITGRCRISVEERQPIAVWEEDGNAYWIDDQGLAFPFEGDWSSLLPVAGPVPRREDGRLEVAAHAVLSELAEADLGSDVAVRYVPEMGFVLTDSQGWQVVLGSGPGTAEKLVIAERLAARLAERGLRPQFVDVRFPSAPYYSLTNSW
jgi:hypothetical protein